MKKTTFESVITFPCMVEAKGVEPLSTACKAVVLPLNEAPKQVIRYCFSYRKTTLVELRGVEPPPEPCEGPVLPLNYSPTDDTLNWCN